MSPLDHRPRVRAYLGGERPNLNLLSVGDVLGVADLPRFGRLRTLIRVHQQVKRACTPVRHNSQFTVSPGLIIIRTTAS